MHHSVAAIKVSNNLIIIHSTFPNFLLTTHSIITNGGLCKVYFYKDVINTLKRRHFNTLNNTNPNIRFLISYPRTKLTPQNKKSDCKMLSLFYYIEN